jgi:hypothetical protein
VGYAPVPHDAGDVLAVIVLGFEDDADGPVPDALRELIALERAGQDEHVARLGRVV